jgi:hypothetical protein
MTGETDRLMIDSAQAELVYHVVTMTGSVLKSTQKEKGYMVQTKCHTSTGGLHVLDRI